MTSREQDWAMGWKGFVGVASCVAGLAVVYFGYGAGAKSPKKDAVAEANPAVQRKDKRPVRAMNLALGNMVFFAHELGFTVKSAKGAAVDSAKIAARIENQLHGVRELYRQAIATNPSLAGGLVLQFRVAPNGEVSQVHELSARLSDGEFKKAVVAQAATWSFAELVEENLVVTCPLLFVHEGMDITTLVQWEKSVEAPAAKTVAARPSSNPLGVAPAHAAASDAPAPAGVPRASVRTDGREFQIKYATSLRANPNFSAPSLLTFAIGTKVTVLRRQGDWLEVRSKTDGPTGFIRKEFVTPLETTRK
jgi:hypothetical protein